MAASASDFDFSLTASQNSMTLDRKQDLNVLIDRSENQDGSPGLWLAETFSTSLWKPLNRIQGNLSGSKILSSSTKVVSLGRSEKQHVRPGLRPSLTFHIFDFFSKTVEWNSTKLERKQDLKVLYRGCVIRGRSEIQDGRPGFWLAETFLTSPLKLLSGIQRNLTGSNILMSSTKLCVFWADLKNKMASLASYWLRHFGPLLWNCWTEFNETCKEARLHHHLPSLYFSGRSEKQAVSWSASDWLRHFWLLWNPWEQSSYMYPMVRRTNIADDDNAWIVNTELQIRHVKTSVIMHWKSWKTHWKNIHAWPKITH